ncbi:MAG TPA: ZIP family metal transporter [Acidobacteriota bacterium]|nr:ZIP family metal transporter [Acidobacteriota bacterium]
MHDEWLIMAKVFLAFALAVAGGVISVAVAVSHDRLCRLISFAAGTLLGVAVFIIIPKSYEAIPLWHLAAGLISGYAVFFLISKYIFHVCPACAASHFDEAATQRFSKIAAAMIIALGLHCIMDGLALAVGKSDEMMGSIDGSLLLAICVHKVPEGLALGALLLAAGFSRAATIGLVAAVESTTILGGILGLWLLPQISTGWIYMVLAHAAGGFIFLAVHAVFGELVKHGKKIVLVSFTLGVAVIVVLHMALHH